MSSNPPVRSRARCRVVKVGRDVRRGLGGLEVGAVLCDEFRGGEAPGLAAGQAVGARAEVVFEDGAAFGVVAGYCRVEARVE